ncbi:putative transcription factor C3H family [Lupinus albus]|uniref:Putative transcription factor C3H family n=1 Tax=Lupinus albus TaxID=3870 RepID=A0A6A4R6M8_LUPAL|nr:putative transcription factor C3H family [Lupinus albus]
MDVDGGNKRVFNRLGGTAGGPRNQKVCYHWQAGKCNRHPCQFLHSELPPHNSNGAFSNNPYGSEENLSFNCPPRRTSNFNTWGHGGGGRGAVEVGNCSFGERCKFLHSWSLGDGFSLLTQLEGHKKVVSGIAFPSGSNQLYTGSTDETVRVWDCQSGQCTAVINLGGEVGCMISEGPWVFVGIPNFVKTWNTQNLMELSLSGPVGQVYALAVINDMLFTGTQDGSILVWKFNLTANCFEPAASLKGHSHGVVSLVVGANRLYSGSMDNTIRDQFLLSCSLDKTVKVWLATESGNLEVTYTHHEEKFEMWIFDTLYLAILGIMNLLKSYHHILKII